MSRHSTQSVHDILGHGIFSYSEGDPCWSIWPISLICNSLDFLSLGLGYSCAVSTPSQTLLPTYMGEVCLLAQDRQNQVRFCNIDYICRKRRLTWWKNSPFCFWRNLWWRVIPTFCLQVNPWTGFNYIIFRGTVCDQGLKDQSYSLLWVHTDLSFVSTLQIPTTSAWCEAKRKAMLTSVRAESLCLPLGLSITRWVQVQGR